MPAKAVLWDLDGVLVDSGRYHYEAFRELFSGMGVDLRREEFFGRLLGLRNDAILRSVLGDVSAAEMRRLASWKEEAFRRKIAGRVAALPGAADLVAGLRGAGVPQAIVSSTPRANIELILRSLALEGAFAAIVAEEDAVRGKPDPEGFLRAASSLGVEPQRCVVLEDAPEGVAAAKAAGMACVAVATTRPTERLSQADLVVKTLADGRVLELVLKGRRKKA